MDDLWVVVILLIVFFIGVGIFDRGPFYGL